jgi:SPP1 gp7 family putative phage head morphogenesis protein
MQTANEQLRDKTIAHEILLNRYYSNTTKKAMDLLRTVEKDLVNKLKTLDIDSNTTIKQVDKQLESIRTVLNEGYDLMGRDLLQEMKDAAIYEQEWQNKTITDAVPIELNLTMAAPVTLFAAIEDTPFQGKLLKEWIDKLDTESFNSIQSAVRMGLVEGQSYSDITRRIIGTKALQYSDGVMHLNRTKTQALVSTAVAHSTNAARDEFYKANDDLVKSVQFVATLDMRTTPICRAKDGQVYPIDAYPRPPLHFRCVLPDTHVTPSGSISYISKRPFNGQVVVIRSSGDNILTVTPNHPIMTDRGFIQAKFLNKGDNLACGFKRNAFISSGNDNQMESSIEDSFNSILRAGKMCACPVPTTTEDFHNDVSENEISVVLIDLKLADSFIPFIAHQYVKSFFKVRTQSTLIFESASRLFNEFIVRHFTATHCGVSFTGKVFDLLRACIVHSGLLLLRAVSRGDAVFSKNGFDSGIRYAEVFSDSFNADSFVEQLQNSINIDAITDIDSLSADAVLFSNPVDNLFTDTEFDADFRRVISSVEHFENVVDLSFCNFSGHVYNLGCDGNVFTANNIITHNCRSVVTAVLKSWKELGLKEPTAGTRASMDGQVPETETYQTWLAKKDAAFQDEVLGKARGEMFRNGTTLDRFVDDSGKQYTLEQLRKIEK